MRRFIGSKKFYKSLMIVVVPIVLQMFITQFVSLLDNLMVGQVGGSEMTGVSLANQLLFVFNLAVFGSMSSASIFGSQYFGAKDKEGYQESFRFKWLLGLVVFTVSTLLFIFLDDELITFFINNSEDQTTDPVVALESAKAYLMIMLVGNLPFIIKEIYSTSLREMKETFVPMLSGIIAIIVNLLFNYLLIFGKFGFPELGIKGAAIATVLSRVVEMLVVVIYSYAKINKYDYFKGAYSKTLKLKSVKMFMPKTIVMVSNEVLWSLGLTLILSCYALRGLDAVASLNICNTVSNVFWTIGSSIGNAAAILLGAQLGASKLKEAKEDSYKILFFALIVSIVFASIMVGSAYLVPGIYKVSDQIKELSRDLILLTALFIPMHTVDTVMYFILRTGGKVLITFAFDSLFIIAVKLPMALVLANFTTLAVIPMFLIITAMDLIKVVPGYILVDKGVWLKVIV